MYAGATALAILAHRPEDERRRAADLIRHARQQAAHQVTITVTAPGRLTELGSLTPTSSLT